MITAVSQTEPGPATRLLAPALSVIGLVAAITGVISLFVFVSAGWLVHVAFVASVGATFAQVRTLLARFPLDLWRCASPAARRSVLRLAVLAVGVNLAGGGLSATIADRSGGHYVERLHGATRGVLTSSEYKRLKMRNLRTELFVLTPLLAWGLLAADCRGRRRPRSGAILAEAAPGRKC